MRNTELDEFARSVAKGAAEPGSTKKKAKNFSKEASDLKLHGNILKGKDIRKIHAKVMSNNCKARQRILYDKFQQFGIGTCKRVDGALILVQVFSKSGRFEI